MMRKRKVRAIAIHRPHPLVKATHSAKEAFGLLLDLMYGTPERTRITLAVSFGLIVLGYIITATTGQALTVCPA